MKNQTLKLFFGCDNTGYTHTIQLDNNKRSDWHENKIELEFDNKPSKISRVTIGPRLIVYFYSGPFMYGEYRKIDNPSHTESIKIDFGCLADHQRFKGNYRSFRIWDYDYHQYIHKKTIRYCQQDIECSNDERCLCPGGETDERWCNDQKKRCIHRSNHLHDGLRQLHEDELLDTKCILDKLYQKNKQISFRDLKHVSKNCLREKLDILDDFKAGFVKEGFDLYNPHVGTWFWVLLLIIVGVVMMYR